MKALTKKWFQQAAYDLKTAEAMLKTCRYLYVAFMCQQAVEKVIKGIIQEKTDQTPPYIHRLAALAEIAKVGINPEQTDFLNLLTRYYISARYPEQKQRLGRSLNLQSAAKILKSTKECYRWLKNDLKT